MVLVSFYYWDYSLVPIVVCKVSGMLYGAVSGFFRHPINVVCRLHEPNAEWLQAGLAPADAASFAEQTIYAKEYQGKNGSFYIGAVIVTPKDPQQNMATHEVLTEAKAAHSYFMNNISFEVDNVTRTFMDYCDNYCTVNKASFRGLMVSIFLVTSLVAAHTLFLHHDKRKKGARNGGTKNKKEESYAKASSTLKNKN